MTAFFIVSQFPFRHIFAQMNDFESAAYRESPNGQVRVHPPGPSGSVIELPSRRRPNFFLIFGAFFGGGPLALAIIDGPQWIFLPFIIAGAAIFLFGLYLAVGKTTIMVANDVVVAYRLFGWAYTRSIARDQHLAVSIYDTRYENQRVPSLRISGMRNGKASDTYLIKQLKDEDMLFLYNELRERLRLSDAPAHRLADVIAEPDNLAAVSNLQEYKKGTLDISHTSTGWVMRQRATYAIFLLTLFGMPFAAVGVFTMMSDTVEMDSGGPPPIWFSLIFLCAGLAIMSGSLFFGLQRTIVTRDGRKLYLRRTIFGFGRELIISPEDVKEIDVSHTGESNGSTRYLLTIELTNGKKYKVSRFGKDSEIAIIRGYIEDWRNIA